MSTVLASQLAPGMVVVDAGRNVEITRVHRGAPKGKVLVSYRSPTGYGMSTVDDTERLTLAAKGRLRLRAR